MSFLRIAVLRTGLCLALLLLLSSVTEAQRFKWWQVEHMQIELGLTTEQVDRLEEVFQSYLPTLRRQKQALDHAETEFDRLVARGDHAGALAQVEPVEAARAALNKSRAHQLLYMRRVLTVDQHAKLTALQRAEREAEAHVH